jgi:hypothetical protein
VPILAQQDDGATTQILAAPLHKAGRLGLHIAIGRRLRRAPLVDRPSILPMTELQKRQAKVKPCVPVHRVERDRLAEMPDRQRLQPQRPRRQSEKLVSGCAAGMQPDGAKCKIELSRRIGPTPLMQIGHGQKHVLLAGRG